MPSLENWDGGGLLWLANSPHTSNCPHTTLFVWVAFFLPTFMQASVLYTCISMYAAYIQKATCTDIDVHV